MTIEKRKQEVLEEKDPRLGYMGYLKQTLNLTPLEKAYLEYRYEELCAGHYLNTKEWQAYYRPEEIYQRVVFHAPAMETEPTIEELEERARCARDKTEAYLDKLRSLS